MNNKKRKHSEVRCSPYFQKKPPVTVDGEHEEIEKSRSQSLAIFENLLSKFAFNGSVGLKKPVAFNRTPETIAPSQARIVSPYFQNSTAQQQKPYSNMVSKKVSPYFHKQEQIAETEIPLKKKASALTADQKPYSNVGSKKVAPYFLKQQQIVLTETGSPSPLWKKMRKATVAQKPNSNVVNKVVSPYFHKQQEQVAETVTPLKRKAPTLTAAQKKDVAYERKRPDNTWNPPPSPIRLLQHDHVHDPWRVLVICMLLNKTSGNQASKVLSDFFTLCPDAKTATEVATEDIINITTSLGFQVTRALSIQRFSREYLDESWTHVTQLHGIGKYGADAYAIFCTGKWEQLEPKDHMLESYWNFLVKNRGNL